jgi:hypothetical protein
MYGGSFPGVLLAGGRFHAGLVLERASRRPAGPLDMLAAASLDRVHGSACSARTRASLSAFRNACG